MTQKEHPSVTEPGNEPLSSGRDPAETVEAAAASRKSIRAYQPRQVARTIVENILKIAGKAPSGSNIQPWKVYVLSGATLARVSEKMQAAYLAGEPNQMEYNYYPSPFTEPFLSRRRATGWGLYKLLGITKGDREKSREFRSRMYVFYNAPVGLVFTIDKTLEAGSWLDYGMFLQTIMLTARQFGLDTCPQASIAEYPAVLRRNLPISKDETIICGMALGYADQDSEINSYQPERLDISDFTTFLD